MVIPGVIFSPTPNYVQPPIAGYGIRLPGATSGAVSIKPAAVAGSVELTLPPSTVAGGVLTDVAGNGVLTLEIPASPNNIVLGEQLTGVINNANATFTTAFNFVPGTVVAHVNGLSQRIVTDYNTVGVNTIIFSSSPQVGDYIATDYRKA